MSRYSAPQPRTTLRCAIYTRKSTEDGLEQEFNSLDAQREACAAYILSQRHEGWTLLPDFYDDGGFSGGTMERPGLKQLLLQVQAGKVDVIVVYKVDRLTRSLADFAKIVEILDNADASFVSVTQAFNTTSSMGRLTLNVLLSFAQFEREVTGERIRDKIAASKRKGMWMGGGVPLGYDVFERKLIVNTAEAEQVRHMFSRYVELGTVVALRDELRTQRILSKCHVSRSGRQLGGMNFTHGSLCHFLKNRTYIGFVRHKDAHFPGEHEAIVEQDLFDRVQAQLEKNRVDRKTGVNARNPSLLAGFIYDSHGRRMSPDHAAKGARKYRYYVSRTEGPNSDPPPLRVPAGDIENAVTGQVMVALGDSDLLHRLIDQDHSDELRLHSLKRSLDLMAAQLRAATPSQRRGLLLRILFRIVLHQDRLEVMLDTHALLDEPELQASSDDDREARTLTLTVPARMVRTGKEMRLVIPPSHRGDDTHHDSGLIKLMVKAHAARAALRANTDRSLDEIVAGRGLTRDYFRVLVKLSFLAPDIIASIIEGRHPPTLSRQRLVRLGELPFDWGEQRRVLGFDEPKRRAA